MTAPRTALIGIGGIHNPNARQIPLIGPENLNPYQLIIWDPITLKEFLETVTNGPFVAGWASGLWETTYNKIRARLERFLKLVRAGSILIVVARESLPPIKTVSRTGSSSTIDLNKLPILDLVSNAQSHGTHVQYSGPDLGLENVSTIFDRMYYETRLSGIELKTLFIAPSQIPKDEHVVGGIVRPVDAKGAILFAPPISHLNDRGYEDIRSVWVALILEIADKLLRGPSETELPVWAELFAMDEERIALERLQKIKETVEKLNIETKSLTEQVDSWRWLKNLYVAADDGLVTAVERALNEIGIPTVRGPKHRADLLSRIRETIIAWEIKGHDGAAKEWAANQCHKWVTDVIGAATIPPEERSPIDNEYIEALDTLGFSVDQPTASPPFSIKGAILANTYRKLPLEKRPKKNFADGIVPMLRTNGLVAMTGLQLERFPL